MYNIYIHIITKIIVVRVCICNIEIDVRKMYNSTLSHYYLPAELEIMAGHQTFSVHIAQMAELSCVCADIS